MMDWVSAHLQAMLYVARAHWHAALARLGPPVRAALAWADAALHSAIDGVGAMLQSVVAFVQPRLRPAYDVLAPHGLDIALGIAAAAFIGVPLLVILRWMRRRRRIRASLVEVTLDRDPQTSWLNLAIVVRNFQPHALIVHDLQVLHPAGTKVCERWQAWAPAAGSARFVAPELDLSDAAAIERTIPPRGASRQYDELGGNDGESRQTDPDELQRSFYLLPPEAAANGVRLHAVLHCEIQNRRRRKQSLTFRRTLGQAPPVAASPPATI